MAYSANGYNFTDKTISRVKYDLLTYEQYIVQFSASDIPPTDYLMDGETYIYD